jgi:hypothetical protein
MAGSLVLLTTQAMALDDQGRWPTSPGPAEPENQRRPDWLPEPAPDVLAMLRI